MRLGLTDLRLFVHVHAAGTITGGAALSRQHLLATFSPPAKEQRT